MSAIKNPQLKKRVSLKRDHRVYPWEGDKSFRGVWRKKKTRMARKARTESNRVEGRAKAGYEDDAAGKKQPRQLRRTGVVTLERDLQIRRQERHKRFSQFRYSSSKFTR